MTSLWKFGQLTPLALIRLAAQKHREDELPTRSASLSYYFLLALFPLILFLLSLIGVIAGPHSVLQFRIMAALGRLAPGSAADLVRNVVEQTFRASSGVKLAAGILGALWAASGGMSAVIVSLNKIYEINEGRPWWKQKVTIISLTLALSALIIFALVLALYGGKIGEVVFNYIGAGSVFRVVWKFLQSQITFGAMYLAFSIVYYFGPSLKERKWYWVTPGSAAGVLLWLLASVAFRIYLHFFNSYSATYGSVGAVVILMLWLYNTGYAFLIGAEVNWVIENEDRKAREFEAKKRTLEDEMKAA
jgi:membrane protein